MNSDAKPGQSWSWRSLAWIFLLVVQMLTISVRCEDDEGKCDPLFVLPPSYRPPLDVRLLAEDINKLNPQTPDPNQRLTAIVPKYVLNYAGCALIGDRGAVDGAITAITGFMKKTKTVGSGVCDHPQSPPDQWSNLEVAMYKNCLAAGTQLIDDLKSVTAYTMRKEVCPKWIDELKLAKRKMLPDNFDDLTISGSGAKARGQLLEYLANPDFEYNICRTINITEFPICIEELGCGYLKATAIDYAPQAFSGLIENTCKYILKAISILETDNNFRNEFPLAELKKDCRDPDFFNSFKCLSVNVTLRQRLKMYSDWYLENKDGKLTPHLENLRHVLKEDVSAVLSDLSKRFHYNISKDGDDCSGSIDFQDWWNRTMNYVQEPPDGTLPFQFLNIIPLDEKIVVSFLKNTCDVTQDLVCGQDCVCVCPKGDKWRTCNGRGAKPSAWNYFVLVSIISLILCIT